MPQMHNATKVDWLLRFVLLVSLIIISGGHKCNNSSAEDLIGKRAERT